MQSQHTIFNDFLNGYFIEEWINKTKGTLFHEREHLTEPSIRLNINSSNFLSLNLWVQTQHLVSYLSFILKLLGLSP